MVDVTAVLVAFIGTLPGLLVAVGTLIVSLRNSAAIQKVHVLANSLATRMADEAAARGLFQGRIEGGVTERAHGDQERDVQEKRQDAKDAKDAPPA